MLMPESFDLNSKQLYADSLKEGLRKTMLDQEIIFRKQVQELHRLYKMQKMLMGTLGLKQFDRYPIRKACTQSAWLFSSSNPVRHKPSASLVEVEKFSSTAMIGSSHSRSQVFPDRYNSVHSSIHQKPPVLQLSANNCPSRVDHEMLNLSLSIGEEDRKGASMCFDKKSTFCPQNIIDLEESTEGISKKEENCAACINFAIETTCESQISVLSEQIISSGKKNNISVVTKESSSTFGHGIQKCHKALAVNKSSMKNEDCIYHEAGKLDLNQVHFDDSSCYSSNNIVTSHSTASSWRIFGTSLAWTLEEEITCPSTTCRKESSKCSNEASDILQWDNVVNSVMMNSNSKSETTDPKCYGTEGNEADLTGSKAVTRTQVGPCKDVDYCVSGPENKNIECIQKHSDDQFTDEDSTNMTTRPVNCEDSNDDKFSSACDSPTEVEDGDGNIVTASCKSRFNADKSGSMKTRQSVIKLENTNLITSDQYLGTNDGKKIGYDCPRKIEPPEGAMCIESAAQLLINFSLGSSSSYQDCSSKAESIEVDKKMDKPQCSDSFELIVLKLEECNADDCCVSSKPYEIDGTEKKDFSFKLKRGRRWKDFQKEVLPGVASLSRPEIQEDVNILRGVLRSREYRKIRAMMADQRGWCAPVRSRRSKRNCVGRRNF